MKETMKKTTIMKKMKRMMMIIYKRIVNLEVKELNRISVSEG